MARFHVIAGADEIPAHQQIRTVGFFDIEDALARGLDDFKAMPSHVVFLGLIYPVVGFFLGGLTLGYNILPLFFPMAAGFALIGPIAAIGLYELSRRREDGIDTHWTHALDVIRSPSFGAIAALGALLMFMFLAWLVTAQSIYRSIFGVYAAPDSVAEFLREVFTTEKGWQLIVWGNAAGFVFALVTFIVSVISFPLLLDRDVGAAVALTTSVRAVAANPLPMPAWGVIFAVALFVGSLPFFVGLAVVIPVLGHATWHLYRRIVV
jgi:uncharacterized membrane protein